MNNGLHYITLKYFINKGKTSKLIYEKNSDYTGSPFIYNWLKVDLVDSHKILSICTRFLAEAFSSFLSLFLAINRSLCDGE